MNTKKCRIAGCTYKVSPFYKARGVCDTHVKRCQGTIVSQYAEEKQCNISVPVDGGIFCEGCKGQTETYQQKKTRLEAENKQNEKKFEKYRKIHEKSQKYWDSLSSYEKEKELERLVENMKSGKYRANNVKEGEGSGWAWDGSFWTIANGKFVSSSPWLVPIQIVEEFMKKEGGFDSKEVDLFGALIVNEENNNLSSGNSPASPIQPSPSENKSGQSSTEENSNGNNSQQSPTNGFGIDPKQRIAKKDQQNNSPKNDNEVLAIDLKNVNRITVREDGKLEIEFNSDKMANQVVDNEQINNSQELLKIRTYCQQNGKTSLNQRELDSIFATSDTTLRTIEETPKGNGINYLLIGGSVGLLLLLLYIITKAR